MRSAIKPYPAYRDSGVEWLGEVPEHWDVRRIATIADLRVSNVDKHVKEDEKPIRLCNYTDVYHNDRIRGDLAFMRATAKEAEIQRFGLVIGDVLLTKDSEDWTDIGVPSLVEYAAADLVCGYHLAMLRPNHDLLDAGYLFRALADPGVARQFRVAANGVTRYGLSRLAIRSTRTPLPPLCEQRGVARFLDHVDDRIRLSIRAKERLIALLEEERQAINRQAVTGQIDVGTGKPYPAYKDSGVEWLGKVPEHWGVRRLKNLSLMQSGDAITAMSIDETGDYPVYGGNGVRGYTSSYTHDGDYVLIGRQGALCGNIHLAHGRFWASEHAVVATLRRGHVLDWFGSLLSVMDLNQYSVAAAQPGLSVDRVMNLWAPVPPVLEQGLISECLAERSGQLQKAVVATRHQIALLHEYRTRIIADVVTGKLDVRDAAAELPSEGDLASDLDRTPAATDVEGRGACAETVP